MPLPFTDFNKGEVLLIDKPQHWTSFDVVAKVRGLTKATKVGHAGTLDPLATGLLVLCTGACTQQIASLQDGEKEYLAEIQLGATTKSYDAEFAPEYLRPYNHITAQAVQAAMLHFTGLIEQVPPAFSALKVQGKRAYALARKGKEVKLAPRPVHVHEFNLISYDAASGLALTHVRCQKGTYVRSLAHDLGQLLGTGAYLAALRRTRVGAYHVQDAWQLDAFAAALQGEKH